MNSAHALDPCQSDFGLCSGGFQIRSVKIIKLFSSFWELVLDKISSHSTAAFIKPPLNLVAGYFLSRGVAAQQP